MNLDKKNWNTERIHGLKNSIQEHEDRIQWIIWFILLEQGGNEFYNQLSQAYNKFASNWTKLGKEWLQEALNQSAILLETAEKYLQTQGLLEKFENGWL